MSLSPIESIEGIGGKQLLIPGHLSEALSAKATSQISKMYLTLYSETEPVYLCTIDRSLAPERLLKTFARRIVP